MIYKLFYNYILKSEENIINFCEFFSNLLKTDSVFKELLYSYSKDINGNVQYIDFYQFIEIDVGKSKSKMRFHLFTIDDSFKIDYNLTNEFIIEYINRFILDLKINKIID